MEILRKHQIVTTVFLFLLSTSFFGYKGFVESGMYANFYKYFCILLLIYLSSSVTNIKGSMSISNMVRYIVIMFVVGIIWAVILRRQSIVSSVNGMAEDLPLVFFFLFQLLNFENKKMFKAIIICSILYIIAFLVSLNTFPNHIFGYSNNLDAINRSLIDLEERGVLRLNVPGADIVVLLFFMVLTYFRKNKAMYFLLIPILIIIFLRGTRTPFFIATSIGVLYLIWKLKFIYKLSVLIVSITLISFFYSMYDRILEGTSTNPISQYVQLTQAQINSNKNDIRTLTTQYFFTQFNDNVLEYIVGNGKPSGNGTYNMEIRKLANSKRYYTVDVGFVYIFVYYGIIGLILYLLLFVIVLKTPVEDNYMFAKLYVIYGYLILPTNVSILWIAPFVFSMNLYIVYRSSRNLRLKLLKFHDNNEF